MFLDSHFKSNTTSNPTLILSRFFNLIFSFVSSWWMIISHQQRNYFYSYSNEKNYYQVIIFLFFCERRFDLNKTIQIPVVVRDNITHLWRLL